MVKFINQIIVAILILTISFSLVNAENFGYNNPSLPQLIEDLFGGKPSSFYMPNNKSVFGNFSFDGTCLEGGVEIKNGIICGQELQVFNITSLNISFQELTIIDNLIVDGNVTADNFFGNFIGNFVVNSTAWNISGTNVFLTNSQNFVGIGTSNPLFALDLQGDFRVEEFDFFVNTSNGRVGVGTISPSSLLEVKGTSTPANLTISNSDINVQTGEFLGRLQFRSYDSENPNTVVANINAIAEGDHGGVIQRTGLVFSTTNTVASGLLERMRIDMDGNVGIGTTTPKNKLNVIGDINISNNSLVDIFTLDFSNGDRILGNSSISIETDNNLRAIFGVDPEFPLIAMVQQMQLGLDNKTIAFLGSVKNFDDIDGFSRFEEVNLNNGTSAVAGFLARNNLGRTLTIGITSSNFILPGDAGLENVPTIFSNTTSTFAFVNLFKTGWRFRINEANSSTVFNFTDVLIIDGNGNLNTTGNLTVQGNTTLKGFLFLEETVEINPGQTSLLRRVDSTGLIGTVGPSIVLKNFNDTNISTSGVNYVWDIGTGNLTIDLHSFLDPFDSSIAVSHYYDDVKGHIWRLNENNNESFFQWETGFDNPLFTINGTGLLNLNDSIIVFPNGSVNIPGILTVGSCVGCGGGIVNSSAWNRSGTNVFLANIGDNVGIGTESPTEGKLQVKQTSEGPNEGITIESSIGETLRLYHSSNNVAVLQNGANSDQITLASDGSVGIGSNTPGARLHILANPADVGVLVESTSFTNTSLAAIRFKTGVSSNVWQWFIRNGDLFVGIQGVEDYMTIKDGGDVGIGTKTPSEKLDVNGSVNINSAATIGTAVNITADLLTNGKALHVHSNSADIGLRNLVEFHNDNILSSGTTLFRIQQDSTGDIINLFDGATEVFTVLDGGNVGIGTSTPGELLEVSGGNIEIDANFTIGSIDGFILGGTPGFLDFGIKKSGFETRFTGIRIDEIPGGGGNLFGTLRFFTDAEGTDFSTERMTITGLGNVGIGTNSPTTKLQVEGNALLNATQGSIELTALDGSIEITRAAGSPFIDWKNSSSEDFDFRIHQSGFNSMNFQSSSVSTILFLDGSGNVGIGLTSPGSKFVVDGDVDLNEALFVTNSGNVGIGTNGPSSKLEVSGILTVSAGSARIQLNDTGVVGADWWILPSTGGTTNLFRIFDNGASADRLVIDGTGKVGIGTTSPAMNFHVLTGGSSELGPTVANRGIAITGISGRSRIYFEATDAPSGERVFMLGNSGGVLSFGSLNNTASAFTNENILTLNHNTGNVGIGITSSSSKLAVQGNIFVNGTGGEIRLTSSDGSIEITRLAGEPFIDWKNVPAEDFDFRMHQIGVNSMNFQSSSLSSILFLDGLGDVGIGTETPQNTLNVIGTGNFTSNLIIGTSISPQNLTMYSADGTAWSCGVLNNGSWVCS